MKISQKLLLGLNGPLSIGKRPFRLIARKIGISEQGLLSILKEYKKRGFIRRFGAVLDHQKIGLKANALVAWRVEAGRLNSAAKILSGCPEISHCYLRSGYSFWPYNLYTMLHASSRKACTRMIKKISRKAGAMDYRVLFTLKEFKKTSADLNEVLL